MNPATARATRLRLPYLLVVTGSAIAATIYLLMPESPTLSPTMCWAVFVGGWVSVVLAWRKHHPHLRAWPGVHWSGAHTLLVVAVEMVTMLMVFLGPLSPSARQAEHREQEREQHYRALQTAIQTQDLAGVEAARLFGDERELLDTRPGWDRDMQANVANPLEMAVTTDNLDITAVLIDQGASPCAIDGHDLLAIAAAHGNVPMMRLLIHHGATVNDDDGDSKGNSPALWQAVGSNQKESVAFLLSHGANPSSFCSDAYDTNWSTLRLARSHGDADIARLLLHAGAKDWTVTGPNRQ